MCRLVYKKGADRPAAQREGTAHPHRRRRHSRRLGLRPGAGGISGAFMYGRSGELRRRISAANPAGGGRGAAQREGTEHPHRRSRHSRRLGLRPGAGGISGAFMYGRSGGLRRRISAANPAGAAGAAAQRARDACRCRRRRQTGSCFRQGVSACAMGKSYPQILRTGHIRRRTPQVRQPCRECISRKRRRGIAAGMGRRFRYGVTGAPKSTGRSGAQAEPATSRRALPCGILQTPVHCRRVPFLRRAIRV